MATKVDRTERVLNLTAILLDTRRPLSRTELRERVEGYSEDDKAFRRAFERDKEVIREVGIPLEVEPIAFSELEGYRIPPEKYYLQGADFTPAELAALHVATMAVQFGTTDEEALWKLGGLGVTDATGFESPISELPTDAVLLDVFQAIQRQVPLRFQYRKSSGETAERTVEPWSLYFQRGRWYLRCLDRSAADKRTFRLDRMSDAVAIDGESIASAEVDEDRRVLHPWEIGTSDPVALELFISQPAVAAATERLGFKPDRRKTVAGHKGAVFTLNARAVDAAISFALEWLDEAVVLGPPEVRAAVIASLKESAAR